MIIIKIRGKLYNSAKETICLMIPRKEMKWLCHTLIEEYPLKFIIVRNETRDDSSSSDMLATQKEGELFIKQYQKKYGNNPKAGKPREVKGDLSKRDMGVASGGELMQNCAFCKKEKPVMKIYTNDDEYPIPYYICRECALLECPNIQFKSKNIDIEM
jgi:hypothetical protein